MLFKNSVRTSKRTPYFTITKINWLTLFKEIITVHHAKLINTKFSINDCQSRWFIYLLLGLRGLTCSQELAISMRSKADKSGPLFTFVGCDEQESLQIWATDANMLNKVVPDILKGQPYSPECGRGLITFNLKNNLLCYKCKHVVCVMLGT
jgi:hypothetical protein